MARDKPVHLGFCYFEVPFIWSIAAHVIKEECEKRGIKTTLKGSRGVRDQILAVEKFIQRGVDAIIISAIVSNSPELLALLNDAVAKGIPVVLAGTPIVGGESFPLVRSDTTAGQAFITNQVLQHIGGKGKVAYIHGRPELAQQAARERGTREVIARYPNVQLVAEITPTAAPRQVSGTTAVMGAMWAREILTQHPDIAAIITSQDNVALGIIDFLEQEGLTGKVVVTGFDGFPGALRAIHQGTMFASMHQPAVEIAKCVVNYAVKLIDGKTVPTQTFLPTQMVTQGNVVDAALTVLHFMPGMIEVQQGLITSVRTNEDRFRSLVELSSDWYWEQDDNYRFVSSEGDAGIVKTNIGKTLWELPSLHATEEQWTAHRALLQERLPFHDFELKYVGPDEAVRYITVSGRPMFDKDGSFRGYRGVGKDTTERRRAAEQIQSLAYYDSLTLLPNRRLFTQQLNRALAQAKRHEQQFAILFIDLDRFKNINDALGHEAGDQLLQEVAERLRRCLRQGDTVSRLGGDEFVVLLEAVNDSNDAATVARKILAHIAEPVTISGCEHQITASIGISLYPDDGIDQQMLMKNADIAMYLAKEQGKNNYQFYSEKANVHSFERLALESNLRRALQNEEFLVHYQAKINIRTGQITGMEALIRWQHPELGLVPPGKFIPIAEETGLIVPIGKWVLRTACVQILAWQNQGMPRLPVAVNLSQRQFFDEALVADVTQIIRDTQVDPTLLELEVTESMVMHQTDKAVALLTKLKKMGIRIAIDDFGTGYSSFALLKRFPIDTIKIDRSFIRGIPGDTEDGALTSAIIAMGKALDLRIVAEGVEEKAQLTFLQKHACDEVQGFYFSKPVRASDALKLLNQDVVDQMKSVQKPAKKSKAVVRPIKRKNR